MPCAERHHPAVDPDRLRIGREAVVALVERAPPDAILTSGRFLNALALDMAIGGSTNSLLHLPAIATKLGISSGWRKSTACARRRPTSAG